MLDFDTFLTTLYVKVDDFCKSFLPDQKRVGHKPSLSVSEVVTISIIGQWQRFSSERDFYGWAKRHLQSAFPNLPTDRSLIGYNGKTIRLRSTFGSAWLTYYSRPIVLTKPWMPPGSPLGTLSGAAVVI